MGSAPLVLLVGPTASGKSTLAERLADRFDGEIVSADALQVYRGLDIGTAKPDVETRARIPHHCVDVLDPRERCTAGRFGRMAREAIRDVLSRGRPCFLVGGSGFYVRATLEGLDPLPRTDPAWRRTLEAVADRRGRRWMHGMLARLDPARATAVGERDLQRILRALEVVLRTGLPLDRQPSAAGFEVEPAIEWALRWPRPELHARIERRVDRMLGAGWTEEVRVLLAAGVPVGSPALQAIGYRDLAMVVEGHLERNTARDRIVAATRRYAKRQISWFRSRSSLQWLDLAPGGEARIERHCHRVLDGWLTGGPRP